MEFHKLLQEGSPYKDQEWRAYKEGKAVDTVHYSLWTHSSTYEFRDCRALFADSVLQNLCSPNGTMKIKELKELKNYRPPFWNPIPLLNFMVYDGYQKATTLQLGILNDQFIWSLTSTIPYLAGHSVYYRNDRLSFLTLAAVAQHPHGQAALDYFVEKTKFNSHDIVFSSSFDSGDVSAELLIYAVFVDPVEWAYVPHLKILTKEEYKDAQPAKSIHVTPNNYGKSDGPYSPEFEKGSFQKYIEWGNVKAYLQSYSQELEIVVPNQWSSSACTSRANMILRALVKKYRSRKKRST